MIRKVEVVWNGCAARMQEARWQIAALLRIFDGEGPHTKAPKCLVAASFAALLPRRDDEAGLVGPASGGDLAETLW